MFLFILGVVVGPAIVYFVCMKNDKVRNYIIDKLSVLNVPKE